MVMLDTFADSRTGYGFQTNALATQEDFRIADNGRTIDSRWDAAWFSGAKRHENRWTAEFEIPFAILRYPDGEGQVWRLNFRRSVPRRSEYSTWTVPGESVFRVTSFGDLAGVNPPARDDKWTFIPYALVSYEKDEGGKLEAGGDIRWRPSSRFGVDLTINPDFALVEADVETINLTRFELRIPEKRPFFLEGNEMYEQRIEQFYSRRIGDIDWGAKTNGKLGATDFSAIATTADVVNQDGSIDSGDYGVARFQRGFDRGSNIGILAASRHLDGDYAGSAGVDTTWFFTDTLGMTAQYLQVHGPTADGGKAWFLRPAWDTARSHFHLRYTHLDADIREDFNAVGFMRDDDRKEWDTSLQHEFWFDEGVIQEVRPRINYNRYYSQDDVLRSWRLDTEVDIRFRRYWEIELYYMEEYKLFEKEFRNDRAQVQLEWDARDGRRIYVYYGKGFNFDSDRRQVALRLQADKTRTGTGPGKRLDHHPRFRDSIRLQPGHVRQAVHADQLRHLERKHPGPVGLALQAALRVLAVGLPARNLGTGRRIGPGRHGIQQAILGILTNNLQPGRPQPPGEPCINY
jgi:hypothetical protein